MFHQNIHILTTFILQGLSRKSLQSAAWYGSHHCTLTSGIFKKALLLSAGVDARIIPQYTGVGYSVLRSKIRMRQVNLPLFPGG
ncbi:MAG: hypothetical protein IPN79_17825 [Saprospiraceae bacterium]|nr:hypothetical protein [Saprospiraceae bacterium]